MELSGEPGESQREVLSAPKTALSPHQKLPVALPRVLVPPFVVLHVLVWALPPGSVAVPLVDSAFALSLALQGAPARSLPQELLAVSVLSWAMQATARGRPLLQLLAL